MKVVAVLACCVAIAHSSYIRRDGTYSSVPTVVDGSKNLTYQGVYQSGVEAFLGIRYGQDTGGQNRFKRPQTYRYQTGTTVRAQTNGPACPQRLGDALYPIYLGNITEISEDCLLLNVKRPNGTRSNSKLPVMVFIHGGSFIGSSKDEIIIQPSGLIIQSIQNGYPVIHVGMNYRLGSFGFAQSDALQQEGSTNAGLRDQRLAIEWVQNNIAAFGGDPSQVTIFGQSSGGLAVGLQIMAYGATKPVPFQRAICESQSLEPGITLNFTRKAMSRLANATGCNSTALESAATIACLRNLTTQQMLTAQTDTYLTSGPDANVGDEWLPAVDGDFLPEAPSTLINQRKFANITTTIGWCDGDGDNIVPTTIRTAQDTDQFVRDYVSGLDNASVTTLLSLYPVSEFRSNPGANLTSEFYRSSRILRDIVFTCNGIYYAQALYETRNAVYLYDQNQTFTNPALTSLGLPDLGVVHTSEFAYVFGNLSHYDVDNFPFLPNQTDYDLLVRESRSWSSFAATGRFSLANKSTLQGWNVAFNGSYNAGIFVIGGAQEGYFTEEGSANQALNVQRLPERCAFLNSPDIIRQLGY